MARRIAWRFRDPVTGDSYYLPVNPSDDDGSHSISKPVNYEIPISTYKTQFGQMMVDATAIHGNSSNVETFSYSGTLYTKEEFDAFVLWCSKPYPWELRDDLGRVFEIYGASFDPSRVRSTKFRWKHSYVFSGIVLRELEG